MKEVDLTKEQRRVVESNEPELVVSAAAGAGKTRVLTERYLRFVEHEALSPDHILTITFTRKAAAEMKRRIVARLRSRGFAYEAQLAETGPIQTIHSFCERLLRENAILAGLDPEFRVLDEAQGRRMQRASLREVMAWCLDESEGARDLARKLAGQRQYGQMSAYGELEESVARAIAHLRTSGLLVSEFEGAHRDPADLVARWREELAERVLDEDERRFLAFSDPGLPVQARLIDAIQSVRAHKVPLWLKRATGDELRAAVDAVGLAALVAPVWRALEACMRADRALDFSALEAWAIELLESREEVQERLADRYRVMLIDEAQDLNPLQHRLVRALRPSSSMLVGDSQQSIYGFRHADLRLFTDLQEQRAHRRLAKNHRAVPGILAFVDRVFAQKWNPYSPMLVGKEVNLDATEAPDYTGVEFWNASGFQPAVFAQWIKDLIGEGERPRDIAVLVRKIKVGIKLEDDLKRAGVPVVVVGGAEDFYTRLEVRDLANALRALADPLDDFTMLAFLRGPAVDLSVDSIALLGLRGNVYEQLATFDAPLPEDDLKLRQTLRWFEPLRQVADRLPAWETLSRFLAASPYLERTATRPFWRQAIMNVRKLLAMATAESDLGPIEFAELIREIQRIRHREGNAPILDEEADAVRIMTIHKAKGLEFPVVVLPGTYDKTGKSTDKVYVSRQSGLLATCFDPQRAPMAALLAEEAAARDHQEELRVLYVGMTRAKRRLCLAVSSQADPTSAANELWRSGTDRGKVPSTIRIRKPDPRPPAR
ncbi:MAG: UvrD-helicase domain-containing protein [Fimbriimonadaceae bacterium]|nr:UvrD-helicase domain-containing protein [Fimbriimonadaceae bacterium]